jgi:iron complex outermembrane receptor protein
MSYRTSQSQAGCFLPASFRAIAVLIFTAVSCPAQPAPQPAAESPSRDKDVVELTPFTVKEDSDVGYLASNTLAGSRLNTSLRDTAASISVLTLEFMKDIGANNLTEALAWSNNSQVEMLDSTALGSGLNDNGTYFNFDTFRVRGIAATKTRNYFPWRLPSDSYNVGRVEESRGPNSVLFGIGSAGGVVNVSTKQPVFGRNIRSATGTVSSYGTYRGTIDLSQTSANGRLAVRLNAMYSNGKGYRLYTDYENRSVHLGAAYKLFKNTRIRAEFETGDVDQLVAPNSHLYDGYTNWIAAGSPLVNGTVGIADRTRGIGQNAATAAHVTLISNNNSLLDLRGQSSTGSGATTNVILDQKIAPFFINTNGPGALRKGYFNTVSSYVEQRIGKNVFLEFGYNHQVDKNTAYQGNDDSPITLKADVMNLLPTGEPNPNVGRYFLESQTRRVFVSRASDDFRLTASTDLDFGKWGQYRLAGLGESEWRVSQFNYQKEFFDGRPFSSDSVNNANLVFRRHYVTVGDWASYYRPFSTTDGLISNMKDPVSGRTLSSHYEVESAGQMTDNPNYQDTAMIAAQARYFKDRLVLSGGYRWDWLDAGTRTVSRDPVTQQFGVNYGVPATIQSVRGTTRTLSTVLHATKNISVFYNKSNSFSLPSTVTRLLPDNRIPGNPTATGQDVGFALAFGEGKYNIRVNYFEMNLVGGSRTQFGSTITNPTNVGDTILDALVRENLITTAEANARRVRSTGSTYDQRIEGYELTFTANPTKNWRIQANYSFTDGFESNIGPEVKAWRAAMYPFFQKFNQSIVTSDGIKTIGEVLQTFEDNFQQAIAVEGQALPGNRKHKANIFSRYTLGSGPVKGLYFGGGYRHQTKNVIGVWPDRSLQYGNSFWSAMAMAGYSFRKVPFVKTIGVQLNVDNVFNKTDPLTLRWTTSKTVSGDGLGGAPLRVSIVEPRTWRLSATVDY